jgi:hypothetical protein
MPAPQLSRQGRQKAGTMTSATSMALEEYLLSRSFADITATTSIIAIALLLAVAAEREILRATEPESSKRDLIAFAVVVFPMVLVFATVIVARFIRLS